MRAVIIGNGTVLNYEYIKSKLKKNDYIICADGGLRHANALGIKPAVLIGDLDSVGNCEYDCEVINLNVKKDFTDSEICIKYLLLKDFDEILMLGVTGNRIDHTLNNLMLLKQIFDAGKKGCIIDDNNEIYYAAEENSIYGKKGDIVSIIPVGKSLLGVTTHGLEYPLVDEELFFAQSRGVSNVMISDKCHIQIKSGEGFIIKSRDWQIVLLTEWKI